MTDFVFAKEFRGRDRYKPGAYIAAIKIADKQLISDPMSEPLRGDRVPYCIVYDAPKLPLYKLIRTPEELMVNPMLRINAFYYITKQVLPPLDRVFGLIGQTNVFKWFQELPIYSNERSLPGAITISNSSKGAATLAAFVSTKSCICCFERLCNISSPICDTCSSNPQLTLWKLTFSVKSSQNQVDVIGNICRSCSGHSSYQKSCRSFECPIFQKLLQVERFLPDQRKSLETASRKFSQTLDF